MLHSNRLGWSPLESCECKVKHFWDDWRFPLPRGFEIIEKHDEQRNRPQTAGVLGRAVEGAKFEVFLQQLLLKMHPNVFSFRRYNWSRTQLWATLPPHLHCMTSTLRFTCFSPTVDKRTTLLTQDCRHFHWLLSNRSREIALAMSDAPYLKWIRRGWGFVWRWGEEEEVLLPLSHTGGDSEGFNTTPMSISDSSNLCVCVRACVKQHICTGVFFV